MYKSSNSFVGVVSFISLMCMSVVFLLSKVGFAANISNLLSSIASIIASVVIIFISYGYAHSKHNKTFIILWVIATLLLVVGNILPWVL